MKTEKCKIFISVLSFMTMFALMFTTVFATEATSVEINKQNILDAPDKTIECGGGSAKYDVGTNTLTLTDATIEQSEENGKAIGFNGDLIIKLVGTNKITSVSKAIYTSSLGAKLRFEGDGSLEANVDGDAIQADLGDIVIDGCTMKVTSSNYGGISAWGNGDGAYGTLTIQNHANVTVNSADLGIAGEFGLTIKDSTVTATDKSAKADAIYTKGEIVITNSTVNAKTTSTASYPTIWGKAMSISNSKVTAVSAGNNAVFSDNSLKVSDSILKATSPTKAIWCNNTIGVSGTSDVLANGGISVGEIMTVTPVSGKLVEFKGGNDEAGAIHLQGSPYDAKFTVESGDERLNNSYIRIKEHVHTGSLANCETGAICDDCGQEYKKIDPNNHTNLVKKEEKAATHLSEGNIEYWYCDGCKKYFKDAAGTIEISSAETITKKLSEHTADPTKWTSDANNHWNSCECGEKPNMAAHTFKWVTDKVATASEKGLKHEECSVCGYRKTAVEIPKTGTTISKPANPVDPTSTTPTNLSNPATGDNSNIILWLVSAVGIPAVLYYNLKKKYSR